MIDNSIKMKKKSIKNGRRITPTTLISIPKTDMAAFKSENTPLLSSPLEESTNLNRERELLKQERENISSSLSQSKEIVNKTVVKVPILPNFNKVTNQAHLDRLSDIYSTLINSCMVPNIFNEILFLFQLLAVKKFEENDDDDDPNIFSCIHNSVYFALSTLSKISSLLVILDGSTLKNLLQIPYLAEYSEEFHQTLLTAFHSDSNSKKFKLASIQGVPFEVDTGNKDNFSDEKSFHSFKKCRDAFYSLYRDWVQNNKKTGWLERSDFARRVMQILEPKMNLSIVMHIVRLFKIQLVTCGLTGNEDDTTDKLEKLNLRLVVPSKQDKQSSILESEQFFYEFIKASDSNSLISHLIIHLSADIVKLDGMEIFKSAECEVVEATREQYFSKVQSLRTMARLLGFLTFLPFQTDSTLPGNLAQDLCWMRNTAEGPLKLERVLREALENARLIVTVPWVVEFLVMMDPIAPQLECYQDVFTFLLRIYLNLDCSCLSSLNRLYLQLCIGTLFENDHFAQAIFFHLLPGLMAQIPEQREQREEGLDGLSVVTPPMIHASFPAIKQLAPVLLSACRNEIRRLTPLTSSRAEASTAQTDLEDRLVKNFFHVHSLSVRQTVEFITDRLVSKAIKHVRNEIKNEVKWQEIAQLLQTVDQNFRPFEDLQEEMVRWKAAITKTSLQIFQRVKASAKEFYEDFLKKEPPQILPRLFPNDIEPKVVDFCCYLVCKDGSLRVDDWIDKYVSPQHVCPEVRTQVAKLLKQKNACPSTTPDESFLSQQEHKKEPNLPIEYFNFIIALKNLASKSYSPDYEVDPQEVVALVKKAKSIWASTDDEYFLENMFSLIEDLTTVLIVFHPSIFSVSFIRSLGLLLKYIPAIQDDLFKQRIDFLLQSQPHSEEGKNAFDHLTQYLAKKCQEL